MRTKKTKRILFFWAVFLGLLFILIFLGSLVSGVLGQYARDEITEESEATITTLSNGVVRELTEARDAVEAMAGSPWVSPALISRQRENIDNANAVLDRYQKALGVSVCYILDKKGEVIASSNRDDPDSFLGKNYKFRPYFAKTIQGQPEQYFALGVTSGKRGFYASFPIRNSEGQIIGVAVIKEELDSLEKSFENFEDCFLIDPHGIVFLSSKPGYLFKALWPLSAVIKQELTRTKQFGASSFTSILKQFIHNGEQIVFKNKKYLVFVKDTHIPGWRVVLFSSARRILLYETFGIALTIFVCGIVVFFFGIFYFNERSGEKLRESEEKYRDLVERANSIILQMDQDGNVKFFNEFAQKFFGYTEDEILGKNVVGTIVPEKDREGLNVVSIIQGILNDTEKYKSNENENIKKNGERVWIAWTNRVVLDRETGQKRILCVGTDITERKHAEEISRRLASIVENSEDAIIAKTLDGIVTDWNEAARELYGYSPEEMRGKSVACLMAPGREEEYREILGQVKSGKVVEHYETKRLRKDGNIIDISLSVSPVRSSGGQIIGVSTITRDISRRKRYEDEIRHAKEYAELLFQLTPSAIYTVDMNCLVTSWNKKAEEITGYRMSEIIGKKCLIFAEKPCQDLCGLFSGGSDKPVSNRECTIITKNKERRVVSKNADFLKDAKGNVFGGIESFDDITEKKKIEDALRESEERFRGALESSPIGIALVATDGHCLKANDALCRMLGFSEQELLTKTFQEITYPEDLELDLNNINQLIKGTVSSYQMEKRYVAKDGRILWGLLSVSLVRSQNNKSLYFVRQIEDITERRKHEEELRKLSRAVEQSPATVVVTDIEGKITYVNPKFVHLTGYTFEEAMGQNPSILKTDVTPPEAYKQLWDTIKSGGTWRGEFCNKKKNGEFYWEHASISPITDDKGNITHFIAVKEDITDRKNAEKAMVDAFTVKNEFISIVSHELRTPLTAIKEGISIVKEGIAGEVNEQQAEFLSLAKRNVERLANLINDVLDYQRLESGRMEFNIQENDINEVVKDAAQTIALMAKNKGIEIKTDLDENLQPIKFDKDRITQVLINLANNAVKFTDKGSVTLKTFRAEKSVNVSVIDTGIGIKEEDRHKLFQTFSQIYTGSERKTGSSGLGLVISRRIIQQHGGDVWVESEFGNGSTFSFWLPIHKQKDKRENLIL